MFQSGKELEAVFSTEGVFYKLEVKEEVYLCRSLAAIRRKGSQTEGTDALFVLLNPGKSMPLAGEDSIPFLSGGVEKLPLMPSTSDNTMHQLMRLMERMDWNYVQIINLTDLRTGRFDEYKESRMFMKDNGDNRHSIFSMGRYKELLDCVERAGLIIAGWGANSSIVPTAEEAYTVLSELGTVSGVANTRHPLYYHPFPWVQEKCVKWLDDMESQLKRVAEEV